MKVQRKAPERKPPPIPDDMLGDCTIDQLSRLGGRFRLVLEPIAGEKVQHHVVLVHAEDLPWRPEIPKNHHVLTFDEFREVMNGARLSRMAGRMLSIEEAFRLTDLARMHPFLNMQLVKTYEATDAPSPEQVG